MNTTIHTLKPIIAPPPGSTPASGYLECVYLLLDPAAPVLQRGQIEFVASPLASFKIDVRAHYLPDGEPWIPSLSDFTEDGKMLRAMLMDAIGQGSEKLVFSMSPITPSMLN